MFYVLHVNAGAAEARGEKVEKLQKKRKVEIKLKWRISAVSKIRNLNSYIGIQIRRFLLLPAYPMEMFATSIQLSFLPFPLAALTRHTFSRNCFNWRAQLSLDINYIDCSSGPTRVSKREAELYVFRVS